MSDTVFRTSTPPVAQESVNLPEPKPNTQGAEYDTSDLEPIELKDVNQSVISLMGIDESIDHLPEEDQSNLSEVSNYLVDILKSKGVPANSKTLHRELESVRFQMGIDPNAEPSVVLDRIGGVIKAWKNLSFMTNGREKKSLFMKLARLDSSSDMNRMVFEEMEKKKVWQ